MNTFYQAFTKGLSHIFCLEALDHILFLLVLCACYDHTKLKRIFWLVTAFTVGHGITFFLIALDYFPSVRSWSEQAIPVTIILTALVNWIKSTGKRSRREKWVGLLYVLAIGFGCIHGLAASLEFKMTFIKGTSLLAQVAGLNLGIEVAQIGVVIIILFVQMLLMSLFRITMMNWKNAVSGLAMGAALVILMSRL
ncbi:MAG: HupE/UreJ family protein [Flavobacteriales bacterium]